MARQTIKLIKSLLEATKAELAVLETRHNEIYAAKRAAEARVEESVKHFNDLKERLATAESENQRMRGYIARVQEDDTVREELVTISDPDGQQQQVPKRKSTFFSQPNDSTDFESLHRGGRGYTGMDRPKPKHWITY